MAAAPSPCTSIFQSAVDSFKANAGLSQKELNEFQMTSLPDLQKAIGRIQKEQQDSKKMMHLKRLSPFLEAMEQYSKVINIFVNSSGFIAFIWGPMKFLLVVTSNFTEAFNALLEGYLEIGENIPQLVQYQQLFENNPYMQTTLVSIFEDILEFHREAVRYFKQRTWRQLFHATWRAFNSKITYLNKSLQQHKHLIESQATLIQFQEFQSLRTLAQAKFQSLEEADLDRRRTSVRQWLCATNSEVRQEDALKRRYTGTGQWLLRDHRFQQWFGFDHCADPLLWLNGIPGAGKTVLASLVIQEARRLPKATVTFFYCKHNDEHKNGFVTVAKEMLSQLLTQNDTLLPHLCDKASKSGEAALSSEALAKDLLETALKSCYKTYIIIDGLDEYSRDDRKEISAWFQSVVQSLPTHDLGALRCLFISQDDGCARKDLSTLSQIKLTAADNKADIEAFCRLWHQRIEGKFGPLEKKEHNITNVVTARAQGMFLFARLVTWNLYEQTTRDDLETELEPHRMPNGLEQAYARIIERILAPTVQIQSRRKNALKLLGWLACAKRPLKWYEIQGAMAIDIDNGIVSPNRKLQEDCKGLCASLVEIGSDESVMLVHSTAKSYLIDQGYVRPPEVESDLAILCLGYLSFTEFGIDKPDDEIEAALLQGYYAFSDYAVCFWALHLEAGISKLDKNDPDRFNLLREHLDVFLDFQWSFPTKTHVVSKRLHENLLPLQQQEFYDRACQAIVASKNQLRPTGKGPSDGEVLRVSEVNAQIRKVLEHMVSSSTLTQDSKSLITQLHGPNWFKCPRLNCQFFHRGFATEAQREQHVSKHERAFTCSVEGCPQSIIGCTTAKELEKHIFESHGIKGGGDDLEFPDDDEPSGGLKRGQEKPTTFPCSLCPKSFTRAYILRTHLRTHTDERPFICSVCGKGFARQNDRKRHEKLHSGEKRFVCRGMLEDGGSWGCGRRFDRSGALGRHFRSKSGRCICPLLAEEAAKRDRDMPGLSAAQGQFLSVWSQRHNLRHNLPCLNMQLRFQPLCLRSFQLLLGSSGSLCLLSKEIRTMKKETGATIKS